MGVKMHDGSEVSIAGGQVWRMRGGATVEIEDRQDGPFPWVIFIDGVRHTLRDNGWWGTEPTAFDLVELLTHPAGDSTQATTFGPLPGIEVTELPVEMLDANPGTTINPKDAIGSKKLPLHLFPNEAIALGCIGMLEGALKYGRNNFIAGNGVIASIYVDALFRHVKAWFEGEEVTNDTKTDHLGNALACLAIIVKARAHGKLIDDRNYGTLPDGERYRIFIEALTPHVARLQAMFADKAPRHFTIADVQRAPSDDTEGGAA